MAMVDPPEHSSPIAQPLDSTVGRLLGASAAVLFGAGLLTGAYVAAAMTGQLAVNPQAALASHLNALMGTFLLVSVAWSLPMLRYGLAGQRRLAWTFIVACFANWLVTAVKAAIHVPGIQLLGSAANDAVFAVLQLTVVLPSLAGAVGWIVGFSRRRT